jgi:hypothetical protein
MEFLLESILLIKSNMSKRSRATFEAITIVADGREYVITELIRWSILESYSIHNPEELHYSICFECAHGELWVRCSDQAEQLNIDNTLSSI